MRWLFCRSCWSHVREDVVAAHDGHDVRLSPWWASPSYVVAVVEAAPLMVVEDDYEF